MQFTYYDAGICWFVYKLKFLWIFVGAGGLRFESGDHDMGQELYKVEKGSGQDFFGSLFPFFLSIPFL